MDTFDKIIKKCPKFREKFIKRAQKKMDYLYLNNAKSLVYKQIKPNN